jgi:hypothetical protein
VPGELQYPGEEMRKFYNNQKNNTMGEGQLGVLWLIIMTLAVCATIFGMRYIRNKENMSMIDKGFNPRLKPLRPRPAPFQNLKWGLLLVGAGLGLFLAYLLDNTLLYKIGHNKWEDADGGNVAIYFALIAIGGGAGLISSYRIEKKELLDKQDEEDREYQKMMATQWKMSAQDTEKKAAGPEEKI